MKRFIRNIVTRFQSVPLPTRIGVGVAVLAFLYIWTFIIPTNVQFSYANKATCANWFMLAPGIQQQRAGKEDFKIVPTDVTSVFGVPLFSTKVCVSSEAAPEQGRVKTSIAPFGLPIFSKTFGVDTPASPTANIGNLKDAEISAVKPLVIPLNGKDVLHTYTLRHGDKTAKCEPSEKGISCAMTQLGLEPSTPYELALHKGYKQEKSQKIETLSIRTLTAVQLMDSTLKNDTTIYDKPADFRYTFDRPLESAEGFIKRADGTTIAADFKTEGVIVVVSTKQPLPRDTTYALTIEQVTGKDGASLAEPLVTAFTMSGGPRVESVSVGATAIGQNARIIVTFDQPVKADIDIAKFAHLNEVDGSIEQASDNSLAVTLASAPQCAAFSITIDKGIPSGSNDEVSLDPWKFDGRVICGSSRVIGYSVRGRAIVAHTFGTGSSTILFTGGMHGSEPSGMTTMQAWVTYLQSNGYKIPADKKVVIVPNTNPDGIAAGSRNNVNNVNIDRNFPASNWRPDIDTASGTLPTGGGTSAGSEPETQAAMAISEQVRPRLSISFHAQGRLVGANQYGDSVAIGKLYASIVGYGTMIGNAEEVMGYSITGEYEDWMGQAMGTPAILIELPTPSGNYLNSQMTALMRMLSV